MKEYFKCVGMIIMIILSGVFIGVSFVLDRILTDYPVLV